MRKISFLFVFICIYVSVFSQVSTQWRCLTESPKEDIIKNVTKTQGISILQISNKLVRVHFHVIRRTNHTGGLTVNQVNDVLNILRTDFEDEQICFVETGRTFIDDDYYFNNFSSTKFNELVNVNPHSNAVDVYLLPEFAMWSGRANGIPSTALVIEGLLSQTSVISHEMGHCLGLYHTHRGRGCGETGSGTCAENINGSNCTSCGDMVCDTPADPCLDGLVNTATCEYTGDDDFNPDIDNIMSYSPPDCLDEFTGGQNERIHTVIANSSILQNVLVNNLAVAGPSTFCTSAAYNANNVPAGQNVTWSVNPSGIVSMTPNGNSVTLNGVGYNGRVTLTATLSCGTVSVSASRTIYYGPPVTSLLSVWGDSFLQVNQPGNFGVVYDGQNVCGSNNKASLTNFTWQYSSPANFAGEGGMACAIGTPPNAGYTITWGSGQTGSKLVHVKASNACGVSNWGTPKTVIVGGMFSINLFPNPSYDIVNISISDEFIDSENTSISISPKKEIPYISKIIIADNIGITKKEMNFHKKENNVSIPISDIAPGMYSVQIYSASELLGSKLLLVTR